MIVPVLCNSRANCLSIEISYASHMEPYSKGIEILLLFLCQAGRSVETVTMCDVFEAKRLTLFFL